MSEIHDDLVLPLLLERRRHLLWSFAGDGVLVNVSPVLLRLLPSALAVPRFSCDEDVASVMTFVNAAMPSMA
jgi:hypothetical protein